MIPALMGIVVVALFLVIAFGNRADSVVRLDGGRATLTRGDLPGPLLGDLTDVARRARGASGTVEIRGEGATLTVKVRGLDGKTTQRVRNVVMVRRRQIRRPR